MPGRQGTRFGAALAVAVLTGASAGCGGPASPSSGASFANPSQPTSLAMQLSSSAFVNSGSLPAKCTGKSQSGLDVETNPPLTWSNPPAGTAGYVF